MLQRIKSHEDRKAVIIRQIKLGNFLARSKSFDSLKPIPKLPTAEIIPCSWMCYKVCDDCPELKGGSNV